MGKIESCPPAPLIGRMPYFFVKNNVFFISLFQNQKRIKAFFAENTLFTSFKDSF
jgi:hypothetical protein